MRRSRRGRALRRRYGRTVNGQAALPRALRGTFESLGSGAKAFVRYVMDGEVFIQMHSGANGNMPLSSFLRQYRKVR
jgi:hypothetical protein